MLTYYVARTTASECPLTSSWPHLRCDVGLEEGEYFKKAVYNGAQ